MAADFLSDARSGRGSRVSPAHAPALSVAAAPGVELGALEPALASGVVLPEGDPPRCAVLVECMARHAEVLGSLRTVEPAGVSLPQLGQELDDATRDRLTIFVRDPHLEHGGRHRDRRSGRTTTTGRPRPVPSSLD